MRCEVCTGTGLIIASKYEQPTPCYQCNGFGIGSCCEVYAPEPEFWQIDRKTEDALSNRVNPPKVPSENV